MQHFATNVSQPMQRHMQFQASQQPQRQQPGQGQFPMFGSMHMQRMQSAQPMQQQPMQQQPMQQQPMQQQPTQYVARGLAPERAPGGGPHGAPWGNDDLPDDDDDDLNNIDMSNMTAEEKESLRKLRKERKMNREKVKRAKLNDQFSHLSKMLAIGKSTRVEKLTVLTATIRQLEMLQAENDGLRMQKRRIKEAIERRKGGGAVSNTVNHTTNHIVHPVKQHHAAGNVSPGFFHSQNSNRGVNHNVSHANSGGLTTGALLQVPTPVQFQPSYQGKKNAFGWPVPEVNNHDLDFALGNSDDEEMGEFFADHSPATPTPNKLFQMQLNKWEQEQQMRMHQPMSDFDSIDMFLTNDDTSDLLCV